MKTKITSIIVLLTVFLFSGTAFAKTDRVATVYMMNMTGNPVIAGFGHKYSNVFLGDGGATNPKQALQPFQKQKLGKARFRTGFGTTGKDWWQVSYLDKKGCKYTSNPKNARKFIDGLEKTSIVVGGVLIEAGVDIALTGLFDPEPASKIAIGALGAITAGLGATMVGLSNTESTAGFKQHILRGKDKSITIMLFPNSIQFVSSSGTSSTGMKLIDCVPLNKRDKL